MKSRTQSSSARGDDPSGAVDASALRQLFSLLRVLGSSRHRRRVGLLAAGIVVIIGANMLGQIRLNVWQGAFYDAPEQKNLDAFVDQLIVFLVIVGGLLTLVVTETWLREMLEVRLREWLTHDLIDEWLVPKRAYFLAFAGDIGVNPDQRMQADCQRLTEFSADLGIGLLRSALLLMSFVGVLWWLSDQVLFAVGEDRFTIPGYLVWCALAYALSGSWLTWRMGRPLIRLNAERYAREAELRFALVRVNEHAEGIALHGGEADERGSLNKPIEGVVEITRQLAYKLARLTWITSGYGWLALVVPILVAAPGYFQDSLSFGELMMAVGAFMVGRIDRVELSRWIDRGWIMPAREGDKEPVFSEADIARIQMICDVRHDLLVEEETIPLVLSLLDQIYALRHQRNTLADAIRRQPEAVRTAILRQLRELDPDRFDT